MIRSDALSNVAQEHATTSGRVFTLSPEGQARAVVKHELESWLQRNPIPSLGELLATHKPLVVGNLFTIYHDFYGRGLSKYVSFTEPLPRDAIAELHNTLSYDKSRRIRILYSPMNLTSSSAWDRLSGRARLFCFCYIERAEPDEIIARPYLIGDPHSDLDLHTSTAWDASHYGELHITQIDQFADVRSIYETEKSPPYLELLRTIPETDIKRAVAEIINEGKIPNDWGGEQSDLFSCNVSVERRYMPTAFLFKGPAHFTEMKMSHLGKNGDQIVRLFSEPARLLVLQHCHNVSNAVRSTMRAFASRVHDLRYFTIIDGSDTIRILSAYKKCGL